MRRGALYVEIDKFAAAWLREPIAWGLIADGDVYEGSFEDLTPADCDRYIQVHLCAGIGVWSYALRQAEWADDHEVWTASFPCQPFSAAGKGEGFADERHLWPTGHYLIEQCRPRVLFGEQVASKPGLAWFDLVHADLEGSGYTVGAHDLCAAGVGAPHIRQRLYFVANTGRSRGWWDSGTIFSAKDCCHTKRFENGSVFDVPLACRPMVDAALQQAGFSRRSRELGNAYTLQQRSWRESDYVLCQDGKLRPVEPGTFPLAHGAPARVGRLRGYGNGLVAPVAQAFIEAAMTCL